MRPDVNSSSESLLCLSLYLKSLSCFLGPLSITSLFALCCFNPECPPVRTALSDGQDQDALGSVWPGAPNHQSDYLNYVCVSSCVNGSLTSRSVQKN